MSVNTATSIRFTKHSRNFFDRT